MDGQENVLCEGDVDDEGEGLVVYLQIANGVGFGYVWRSTTNRQSPTTLEVPRYLLLFDCGPTL